MAKSRPDFLNITLSAAGEKLAGDGRQIHIANSRMHYTVKAGEPTEVLTSEWRNLLSLETYQGEPIFAIDPAKEAETNGEDES